MKLITYLGLLFVIVGITIWLSLSIIGFMLFVAFGSIIFSEDFTARKISEILGLPKTGTYGG